MSITTMTRTFKITICETTEGSAPSHPLTIEVPGCSEIGELMQFVAALPLFQQPGTDLVRLPKGAKVIGDNTVKSRIK